MAIATRTATTTAVRQAPRTTRRRASRSDVVDPARSELEVDECVVELVEHCDRQDGEPGEKRRVGPRSKHGGREKIIAPQLPQLDDRDRRGERGERAHGGWVRRRPCRFPPSGT